MSFRKSQRARIATLALGALIARAPFASQRAFAQEEATRKVRTRVPPSYPDLARRLSITGTVKVMVVVSPSGSPKDTRVLGGNPVLANAALDAVKKWKFEPAQDESTVTLEFNFQPKRTSE